MATIEEEASIGQMLHRERLQKEQMEIFRIKRKQKEFDEMQDETVDRIREVLYAAEKEEMDATTKINSSDLPRKINDACMLAALQLALSDLRECKPSERCERARNYVVTITEMEKVVAYFKTWVVDGMKIGE